MPGCHYISLGTSLSVDNGERERERNTCMSKSSVITTSLGTQEGGSALPPLSGTITPATYQDGPGSRMPDSPGTQCPLVRGGGREETEMLGKDQHIAPEEPGSVLVSLTWL